MNPYVEIDWREGFANDPELVIHEQPLSVSEFVFKSRGPLYFAYDRDTKQVCYFAYSRPGNGYGGHVYRIRMETGDLRDLYGPWSSRASVMNGAGFPKSVECTYVDQFGYRSSGAILVSRARSLLFESGLPAEMVRCNDYREGEQAYKIVKGDKNV